MIHDTRESAPRPGQTGRRIVIVGASAAGLRCAARLKRVRPGWHVIVVEQREIFSDAACGLPYILSGDIDDPDDLRRTSWGSIRDTAYFERVKGLQILTAWRATALDPAAHELTIESGPVVKTLGWDELILATGARPRTLPGIGPSPLIRTFHTRRDMNELKEMLIRGDIRKVAIAGAGAVGCELAEAFRSLWGVDVTLIEAAGYPLPAVVDSEIGALVTNALRRQGVTILCGSPVRSVTSGASGVRIEAGPHTITADMLVVAIGVEPAAELAAAAGIAIGRSGAIAVDERLATSAHHVWAAGDCIEVRHAVTGETVHLPLGSLANRQGRVLANVLAGIPDRHSPAAGAMAVKIFDLNLAATGCSVAQARRCGLKPKVVWLTCEDRAHYWPETHDIQIEVVFDPASRELLGITACGEGNVARYIDVATQLILQRATLDQLARIEHAYTPSCAPALDPLAVAAFVAQNCDEDVEPVSPLTSFDGYAVLDVREPPERSVHPLTGVDVMAIPFDELRERVAELRNDRSWVVVCERGTRSAEAVRWLAQAGLAGHYLGGGMIWRVAAGGGGHRDD